MQVKLQTNIIKQYIKTLTHMKTNTHMETNTKTLEPMKTNIRITYYFV